MEDRRASLMAVAMGGVAVGGFWLARPAGFPVALPLLEQRVAAFGGIGIDRDAAAVFRFEAPTAVRDALEDNLPVVFRIVDRKGRVYPLAPMADPAYVGALKLPIGYAETPESPRLEAAVGDRSLASVALHRLPPAHVVALPAATEAPIRLVYRGDPWIDAEPKAKIPADERWSIVARRTNLAANLDVTAFLPSRVPRWGTQRLPIPFPDQASAVEVEVSRFRLQKVDSIVRLKGLRLVRRFGGTALVVDRPEEFETSLHARVVLPRQDLGPHRASRYPDPRIATATLAVVPPWTNPRANTPLLGRERSSMVEILSPSPERLGLRELRIGAGTRRAVATPAGSLREGPFEAVVRITLFKPVLVHRQTAVVRIMRPPNPL